MNASKLLLRLGRLRCSAPKNWNSLGKKHFHDSTMEAKKKLLSNLRGRDLVSLDSWTREDIFSLLWIALDMKESAEMGATHTATLCKGKTLTCLYEDIVTVTGISKGMACLGGVTSPHHTSLLNPSMDLSYFGRALSSSTEFVIIDSGTLTLDHVEQLASGCQNPVLNFRCKDRAPLLALAECLTLFEHYGYLRRLVIGYLGDVLTNPVVNSYVELFPKIGVHFRYCSQQEIPADIWEKGIKFVSKSSFKTDILQSQSYDDAVYRAHVIVTKYSPSAPVALNVESMEEAELDWTFFHHSINDGTTCAPKLLVAKQCLLWKYIENISWITRAAIVATAGSYKPSTGYPGFQGVD